MIIDAENKVLGRLATEVAQLLQDGEEVDIVNAEKAVVTGDKEDVYDRYRAKRKRGSKYHGPHYPKAPERIVKRTVRGMLPDNAAGRDALKRLKAYRGNPEDWEASESAAKETQDLRDRKYVTIEDISAHI